MKDCFVVTSCIGTSKNSSFKGTNTRSFFSDAERLDQTIFSLRVISQRNPNSKIFLVDASEQEFPEIFSYNIPNLSYIRLELLNPVMANVIRTHSSKSHCECLILLEFLRYFKKELKEYDFVTKVSGRYLYRHGDHSRFFIPANRNKFFFKEELVWGGPAIDTFSESIIPKEILIEEKIHGFPTVMYGFGIEKLDVFEAVINACAFASTEHSNLYYVDIEYTINYFIRKLGFINDVVATDWFIDGRCGVTGNIMIY